MRVLGYILLTLVCLVLSVGTFLFIAAPVEIIRDQIVATVKRETGRDLVIRGRTSFAVYPNLGVSLSDVELSPPPGMAGDPFLRMASLKIAMPLLALLERKVSIDEFVLERPEINLRVDAGGRRSWDFSFSKDRRDGGAPESEGLSPELKEFIDNSNQSQGQTSENAADTGSGLAALRLGDVRVVDGVVQYIDDGRGTSETIADVNVAIGLEALTAPLSLDGTASWKGRAVPVRATVTSLDDVVAGRAAKINLILKPQGLNFEFDGVFDPVGDGSAKGQVKLASADVADLSRWLTGRGEAVGPLKSVSLEGAVSANATRVAVQKARFAVNDLSGTGAIGIRLKGRKKLEGDLQVGAINTASFLGAPKTLEAGPTTTTPTSTQWSAAPIDLSGLRAVDAGVRVAFASLAHNKIRLGKGTMAVALKDGLLRIAADPLSIYQGGARGAVTLDARGDTPSYTAQIEAKRIAALPLLKALADFDWLSGAATAQVNVRGSGASQRAMMKNMNGTAALQFTDGAIEGLSVAKILRGVQQGRFNNFDRVAGEKTDFSALSGSFEIANGVANNKDLRLVGPLVRAAGAGAIDIGGRSLNYRMTPKLVASLEGQGGADQSGIEIPLIIQGPWSKPRVAPDLDGLLKDPASAAKNLGGLVDNARKKIKSKKVNDLLESVLGGGAANGDTKKEPLGGLLGDFLKQQ